MRGRQAENDRLFSFTPLRKRIPEDHPLRAINALGDAALARLSPQFDALYSRNGRPSIAPEMLLRTALLQAFFSIRSARQLVEQIDYNLPYRWFVGSCMDGPTWHATVFTHNRDRLFVANLAQAFLSALLSLEAVKGLLSSEHFSVAGTLIDAWASMKRFQPKDGSGEPPRSGRYGAREFGGEKRSNDLHASATDPDARLYRKGDG